MQPILVRPIEPEQGALPTIDPVPEYEIVSGERRYRASKLAEVDTIPAIIRELSDIETLQLQIIENLQRIDIHALEEAQGFKAILDNKEASSWNADQLAEKIGKSRSYVYNSLKLNELCTYVQDMFLAGKFGREIALLIARIPGAKLQEQATKEIISRDLSYRVAKGYIQQTFTLDLSKAPWDKHSSTLYPPAGSCLSCPKRSGNYPELFADIESLDVCTDTACYAAKKVAYAQDLIQHHPKVIHGKEAEEIAPYGVNAFITHGFVSDANQVFHGGYKARDLLGDDLPEPNIVIDSNNNTKQVWDTNEVKNLMEVKLREKIESGELQPAAEKPKTPQEIEREEKALEDQKLVAHRQNLLNGLVKFWQSNKWTDDQYKKALQTSVSAQFESNSSTDAVAAIKNAFNTPPLLSDQVFIESLSTLELSIVHMLLPSAENVDMRDMDEEPIDLNLMLDIVQIDTLELLSEPTENASTPTLAAHANEIKAEDGTAVETSATPESASAGEPILPPKLQEIKERELARRARKAARQAEKVSASADV